MLPELVQRFNRCFHGKKIKYCKKNTYLLSVAIFYFQTLLPGIATRTFRCPSLESLESLWSDYQSGHLNNIAERYLVTDDIKKKLNLENVRLETTIEEENYRICKEILMEKSCKPESSL